MIRYIIYYRTDELPYRFLENFETPPRQCNLGISNILNRTATSELYVTKLIFLRLNVRIELICIQKCIMYAIY